MANNLNDVILGNVRKSDMWVVCQCLRPNVPRPLVMKVTERLHNVPLRRVMSRRTIRKRFHVSLLAEADGGLHVVRHGGGSKGSSKSVVCRNEIIM